MLSFVLFFKPKAAYDMRISDWSSDVCSSDLGERAVAVDSLPALVARLDGTPVVVILGPSCVGSGSLIEATNELAGHTEAATILVTNELSTELLQGALRAGVKDVLTAPVEDDVLIAAIDRAGAALGLVPQPIGRAHV